MVRIELEHIEHRLRIALIVLARDRRFREELAPLFGHALYHSFTAFSSSIRSFVAGSLQSAPTQVMQGGKREVKEREEKKKERNTHRKSPTNRIKPHMNLMHEIRRRTQTPTQRTPRINIVLPSVQLLVPFKSEIETPVGRGGLEEETVGFEVGPFDVGDVGELDGGLGGGGLWGGGVGRGEGEVSERV